MLIGSDFEIRVWEKLLKIPLGAATTYSDLARRIEQAERRARGGRRGRAQPALLRRACHRVLGRSGSLTGYHWGLTRKRAILGWEAGMVAG